MKAQVNLSSNGKINGIPKTIYIDYFKNKHWRELSLVYEGSDDMFENVLTVCLDDVIDFEKSNDKTTNIKTVDDLPTVDKLKLFMFQVINCKSDEMNLLYKCEEHGDFKVKMSITNLKERVLKHKLGIEYLDDEKKYRYKIPIKKDF